MFGDAIKGIPGHHHIAAGNGYHQLLPGAQVIRIGQTVGLDQHIDGHAELFGQPVDRIARDNRISLSAEGSDRGRGRWRAGFDLARPRVIGEAGTAGQPQQQPEHK